MTRSLGTCLPLRFLNSTRFPVARDTSRYSSITSPNAVVRHRALATPRNYPYLVIRRAPCQLERSPAAACIPTPALHPITTQRISGPRPGTLSYADPAEAGVDLPSLLFLGAAVWKDERDLFILNVHSRIPLQRRQRLSEVACWSFSSLERPCEQRSSQLTLTVFYDARSLCLKLGRSLLDYFFLEMTPVFWIL